MKPIIGLTSMYSESTGLKLYKINADYVNAIKEAGGIPILLPSNGMEEDYVQLAYKLDGLLIPGGGDISSFFYGEEAHREVTSMKSADDRFEFALVKKMAELNKPIIGICRGIQIINVAFGGNLYQDIPTQHPSNICHYQKGPRYEPFHYVNLEKGSRLAQIFDKERLAVNSFHHQAVKDVAPYFHVAALSNDGLVEAIEHNEKYIIGVQWHPEGMMSVYPEFKKIFDDFILEASK